MAVKETIEEAPAPGAALALRTAFARGISADSAAVFLAARQRGLDWQQTTQAVASGLAERYGMFQPRPVAAADRRLSIVTVLTSALMAYALLRPLLGFGHELTVAALASILHLAVGTGAWEPVIRSLGLDPIYTGAAIRAAGGVQVAGFAVAGPIGAALHAALPGVFLTCDQVAGGAGVSMVAAPGAPAIGRGLAAFGADVVWLAVGLWLFWHWRHTGWRIATIGLLIQAQIGVNHLFEAPIALSDLDASGLPFALQVAVPNGGWFTSDLAALPGDIRGVVLGGSLLVLGYVTAALVLVLARRLGSLVCHRRTHRVAVHRVSVGAMKWSTTGLGVLVALATALSPIGALAVGSSSWHVSAGLAPPSPRSATRTPAVRKHSLRLSGATPVSIVNQSDGSWQYVVDGTVETVRGVGYNPWYASLSPAQ
ncbi:MAG TPA: hypothetical protein VF937_15430, partial [Chloroflexota bacterium]